MRICCPGCQLEGELPDDGILEGVLGCPRCGTRFEQPRPESRPEPQPAEFPVGHSLLVGGPISFPTEPPSVPSTATLTAEVIDTFVAPTGATNAATVTAEFTEPAPDAEATTTTVATAPPPSEDDLFVYVGSDPMPATTPPPVRKLDPDANPSEAVHTLPPVEPPPKVTRENAAAHFEWIEKEVQRFNQYVTQQLEFIRNSRLDLTRVDADLSAAILKREQELSRERTVLAGQLATLERRGKEIEADHERRKAELVAEFRRLEAELDEKRAKLDQRIMEVERVEAAAQRRLAELEEMEEALREELEENEREVVRQRREVEATSRELRNRVPPAPPAPATPIPAPELIESLRSILKSFEAGSMTTAEPAPTPFVTPRDESPNRPSTLPAEAVPISTSQTSDPVG